MKKKSLSLLLTLIFILVSCGDNSSTDSLAEKRIFQYIDVNGLGMLDDLEIISVEKINDTTYKAIHTFTNSLIEKEIQVTRNYIFTNNDSIKNVQDLKVEMKSKGEWVKAGF